MNSQQLEFSGAGQPVRCTRCDVPLKLDPTPRNPDARLLRRSVVPVGVCANCAVTSFLMNTYPVNMLLDERGPGDLSHPGLRDQFTRIMAAGNADMRPEEIDWPTVLRNWNLPVKVALSAVNPYMPTGSNIVAVTSTGRPARKRRTQ